MLDQIERQSVEGVAVAATAPFALCLPYLLAVSATYELIPADSPMISFACE